MASMTRARGVFGGVVLAGALAGCGGAAANASKANSASTVDDGTADLTEYHRYHHHGGVTLLIAMSLDTLGVAAEHQAAVEKIRGDLHAKMAPARDAEQALVTTLADGVAVANFDAAKVDAAIAQVTATCATGQDASAGLLNELHALLTPGERSALVDKVESHWAVWQKANAEEQAAGAKPDGGHLDVLAKDLGLTPSQVDTVRSHLGDAMKGTPKLDVSQIGAHLRAFGDAFRSESFDAKVLSGARDADARVAGWGAARMARFVETVSPVLTPDQRAQFAQGLRGHASHNLSVEGGA